MTKFQVHSLDPGSGASELLVVEADNELDAARQTIREGKTPFSVRPQDTGLIGILTSPLRRTGKTTTRELALFAEQLAELLNSGLTLEQSLLLLHTQDALTPTARLAERLLRKIRDGQPLSAALVQEPGIPAAFVGIVRGAERGGALGSGFATLAAYLERQAETTRRIQAALAYPLTVLVVAILATAFILTVVIPEFALLFAGEEARLPLVTRAVLLLSEATVLHAPACLLAALALGLCCRVAFRQSDRFRKGIHSLLLRLPPVQYARKLEFSRTVRVLGALLSSGVEASEAMEIASASATTAPVRVCFSEGARLLREGRSITSVFSGMPGMPHSVTTLIAVGERTGEAGKSAMRAAQLLESDTNRRIERFLSALNPVAIVTLGGIVAGLVASVMLGIMSINQLALR